MPATGMKLQLCVSFSRTDLEVAQLSRGRRSWRVHKAAIFL